MIKRGFEIALLCLLLCAPAAPTLAKVNICFIPKLTGSAAGEAACRAAQAFAEENGFTLTPESVEKPTAAAQVSAVVTPSTTVRTAFALMSRMPRAWMPR